MTTDTHKGKWAHRLGLAAGRTWRSYARGERKVAGWLVARGSPAAVAKVILWLAKLVLLGVLLYAAFWLALLLLFAVAVAWSAGHSEVADEDEWPFISLDEPRKAHGYDPVPYNDFDHPDYPDEKDL